MDLGSSGNLRELGSQRSTSALQDEVDMLQEENESLLEKLRLAEDKCEEADARAKQLEKQVEILGEGVTMDVRLISRKEAALQQREAALRVASQNHGGRREDVSALHSEAEIAREEAASSLEQLHEVELELKSLKTMTKRLILTQEEMEEVVLKRCWLSRYWGLCVSHGIQADIAGAKHEYWSSFVPLPLEIVLSAGQRARDGVSQSNNTYGEREKSLQNLQETSGEGNIESMIWVENGLRELASLKVQEAVAFVMAQNRRSSSSKFFFVSDEVTKPVERDGKTKRERNGERSSGELLMEMVAMYSGRFYANKPELAARRIEAIGYQVGHQLSERYTMERPRFTDHLEAIKFICKDFWSEVFRKQIDNLKTNHRGTFVLQDNKFRWLSRVSIDPSSEKETEDPSTPGESKAAQAVSMYLYFPCGIIRGVLSNLGIPCAVSADISSLPTCSFVIRVKA